MEHYKMNTVKLKRDLALFGWFSWSHGNRTQWISCPNLCSKHFDTWSCYLFFNEYSKFIVKISHLRPSTQCVYTQVSKRHISIFFSKKQLLNGRQNLIIAYSSTCNYCEGPVKTYLVQLYVCKIYPISHNRFERSKRWW